MRGGISSDGKIGIITKECLLDRNPSLTTKKIETILKQGLELIDIVWLDNGLYSDETKGHADEIVAFKNNKEILLAWTDDSTNPNFNICRKNYHKILDFYRNKNMEIIIHKIITPKPFTRRKNEVIDKTFRNQENPVAISYINFLNLGNVILLPQFDVPEDKIAYKQFKSIFKNYKIIKFKCREIALGGGGIHCVTKNY